MEKSPGLRGTGNDSQALTIQHTSLTNILLITTDQQRWDHLGLAGLAGIETPNLDRLGREGQRFNRAYCLLSFAHLHAEPGFDAHRTLSLPARRMVDRGEFRIHERGGFHGLAAAGIRLPHRHDRQSPFP